MKTNIIDDISKVLAKRTNRRNAFNKLSKICAVAATTGLALRPVTALAKRGKVEKARVARAKKICRDYCEEAIPLSFLSAGGDRDGAKFSFRRWVVGSRQRLRAWQQERRQCQEACNSFVLTGEYASFGKSPVFKDGVDLCDIAADELYELVPAATDTCEGQPEGTPCRFETADLFGGAATCYEAQCMGGVCMPVFSREGAVCIPDSPRPQDGSLYFGSCDTVREQCVWVEYPQPCGF